MFISSIIPTINRKTLSRSVKSVLEQEAPDFEFELIIVNDSGNPLPDYPWLGSPAIQVIHTQNHNRSIARNTGAALAKGDFLHFLDDDDWMLSGAFLHFWQLSNTTQAHWLYGGYKLVDNSGVQLRECHPDEKGNCLVRFLVNEWLPIQVSAIRAQSFFQIGGFAPLDALNEDVDITRRISLTQEIAGTPELVAAIRIGEESSTTDYSNLSEMSRTSRDKTISYPGAFPRIRDSAATRLKHKGYWHGKMVWIYLTSSLWNLQKKRIFHALSRMAYGLASFVCSFRFIGSQEFWRGILKPHITRGWLEEEIF